MNKKNPLSSRFLRKRERTYVKGETYARYISRDHLLLMLRMHMYARNVWSLNISGKKNEMHKMAEMCKKNTNVFSILKF